MHTRLRKGRVESHCTNCGTIALVETPEDLTRSHSAAGPNSNTGGREVNNNSKEETSSGKSKESVMGRVNKTSGKGKGKNRNGKGTALSKLLKKKKAESNSGLSLSDFLSK
ncbi:hypothetical protein DAMA08_016860 [Martiniozyma asiatica (nom. inval.)]|nr:hypothetical protein DAMA08_016860 [Martiniozyma asiatica]